MRWLTVAGLALQLLGTWFLCRIFFRVNPLVREHSRLWAERLGNSRWDRLWSAVGKSLFRAPKMYADPGGRPDEVTANPNATFAFLLIALGAFCQIAAATLS